MKLIELADEFMDSSSKILLPKKGSFVVCTGCVIFGGRKMTNGGPGIPGAVVGAV